MFADLMLSDIHLCNFAVQKQRLLFACMVWFTFMYFFWKLGDPFPILSPKHGECVKLSSLGGCHLYNHIAIIPETLYS